MDSELSSGTPPFSDFSSLHLPLVIFPDGLFIVATNSQIAEKIGLKTRAQMAFYDLIIIGGGLAGLAAVYGASEGLHTLVVEKQHQEVKQALALK